MIADLLAARADLGQNNYVNRHLYIQNLAKPSQISSNPLFTGHSFCLLRNTNVRFDLYLPILYALCCNKSTVFFNDFLLDLCNCFKSDS